MRTKKEEEKYKVIEKLVNKEITNKEAQYLLKKSRQQIYRLTKTFYEEGEAGFIHKNRGKVSSNKIDDKIMIDIKNLYLEEYFDYNFAAFFDVLQEEYNYDISYDTILKKFKSDDIISPLAYKNTIKLYNEKMNKSIYENKDILDKKIDLFQSRQIAFEKAHTRKSSNLYGFGQEVQMDACEKKWFGNIVSFLHLAVDKGTKKVLFGWFEFEEITRGYFVLLFNIIINYGIPEKIKTDNRNSFSNHENIVDTTQFGMICNELGINLVTTSVATAKANIERANGTFKNRLISELRHKNITNIDEANEYINKIFIPKMNRKFSYKINSDTNKMKLNNYTEFELNLIISEKYKRIIDNASSIKFNNTYYIPVDQTTGEVICFMKKTECEFLITYNAEYWCKIENNYYLLIELKDRSTTMKKEIDLPEQKEKIKYTPPADHPWRKKFIR